MRAVLLTVDSTLNSLLSTWLPAMEIKDDQIIMIIDHYITEMEQSRHIPHRVISLDATLVITIFHSNTGNFVFDDRYTVSKALAKSMKALSIVLYFCSKLFIIKQTLKSFVSLHSKVSAITLFRTIDFIRNNILVFITKRNVNSMLLKSLYPKTIFHKEKI